MQVDGSVALVTGGASGLGAASARLLARKGARVVVADVADESGEALAAELGDAAVFAHCDVTAEADVAAAVRLAISQFGRLDIAVGCAGVGFAGRMVGRDGAPTGVDTFERVVRVNLIGMYSLLSHASAAMLGNQPDGEGERGLVVMTASIAAFDGQIGQIAYAASKGGVASLTLPAARELAHGGVRVMTVAPGLFDTPLLAGLPESARTALGESVPFPSRLGDPAEFAELVGAIAENPMLNAETIRLDGGLRMAPR